jgi:hypothetical protein
VRYCGAHGWVADLALLGHRRRARGLGHESNRCPRDPAGMEQQYATIGPPIRAPGARRVCQRYVFTVRRRQSTQPRDGRRLAREVWSEDRIRNELHRFLADRFEWPTYREFQRNGFRRLRDAVTQAGGAERWAQELGVRFVRHPPGYAPVWTDDRIYQDLRSYLSGRSFWPSREEFERDGLAALRNAVNRTGGPDRWAAEFGLPREDRLSGTRRGWTTDLIEAELDELIGNSPMWPTRREFDAAGLSGLLSAIYAREGPDYWAKRFNVRRRRGDSPRPRHWTQERIREELEPFCAGREAWPTEREFVDAGLGPLYRAASRAGGIPHWADQLGLPRRRMRP